MPHNPKHKYRRFPWEMSTAPDAPPSNAQMRKQIAKRYDQSGVPMVDLEEATVKYRPTLSRNTQEALSQYATEYRQDPEKQFRNRIAKIKDPGARQVFENRLNEIVRQRDNDYNYKTSVLEYDGSSYIDDMRGLQSYSDTPEYVNSKDYVTGKLFDEFNRALTDYSGIAGSPTVNRTSPWRGGMGGQYEPAKLKDDNTPGGYKYEKGRAHMRDALFGPDEMSLGLPEDYDEVMSKYPELDRLPSEEGGDVYNKANEWDSFIAEMAHSVDKNMRYHQIPPFLRVFPYGFEALKGELKTALEGEDPSTSQLQYHRPGDLEHRTHSIVEPYYSPNASTSIQLWNNLSPAVTFTPMSTDRRRQVRVTPWR